MRKSLLIAATALAAIVPLLAAPAADSVVVKLATIAPKSSTFYSALTDMGAAWTKATEGRIKLTVFPDGTQGTEPATISLMQPPANQLQAALLTMPGLTEIDDAFNVFAVPFFFQSEDEVAYVQQKLAPVLAKRAEAKGFHLINWESSGWVQVFSKKPIRTLADLKAAKLFTSQGDDKMVQWYKKNGFNPQALSTADMVGSLSTGLIDAVPLPAYPASVLQLFRNANYMLEVRVTPLLCATVITDRAWNKIAPEDRAKMLTAAQAMEKRIFADAPTQDANAVKQMKERGLVVTTLDAKAMAEFHAEAEKLKTTMRGGMVPADIYDLALAERDAYRKNKK